MVDFLPFALPDLGEREIAAVGEAINSGWVTSGPKTKAFESAFAAYLERHDTMSGQPELNAIAVNSATSGLHLALEAVGVGPGDEVIAPSLTFTATIEIARYLGADAVLVDVDPVTLNIDPKALRAAITPRTKAVMAVHYAGLGCEMAEIHAIAKQHNLRVIEDAAHALPTTVQGAMVGTLASDATVFSFYANKTITTGEGGMIVTRDPELARRMRIMRLHGIDRDAFDRFRSETANWYYEVVAPGFKYNMTDVAAAMGIVQLERLDGFVVHREALAQRYHDLLSDLPLILPSSAQQGDRHAWHLYVIRLAPEAIARGIDRDGVIAGLTARGIGTSVHYVPLHRQPYWRDRYALSPTDYPVAEAAYQTMISIPLYTKMTNADQDRVINALRELLG